MRLRAVTVIPIPAVADRRVDSQDDFRFTVTLVLHVGLIDIRRHRTSEIC